MFAHKGFTALRHFQTENSFIATGIFVCIAVARSQNTNSLVTMWCRYLAVDETFGQTLLAPVGPAIITRAQEHQKRRTRLYSQFLMYPIAQSISLCLIAEFSPIRWSF